MQNHPNPDRFSIPFSVTRPILAGCLLLTGLVAPSFAAEPTTPEALHALGLQYLKGEGVPRDEKKCFDLARKAADQGHADALATVGYLYSVGSGVEKNDGEARKFFALAADKGSVAGQSNLGLFLIRGRGGERDAERGVALLRKAVAAGNQQSAVLLGEIFYLGQHADGIPDYSQAREMLLGPAEAGHAAAQNTMGVMLKEGRLGKKDDLAARIWLEKSAVQGNAKACFNLGELLWNDRSHDRWTRLEALRWLIVGETLKETMAYYFLEDIRPTLAPDELKAAEDLAALTTKALPGGSARR